MLTSTERDASPFCCSNVPGLTPCLGKLVPALRLRLELRLEPSTGRRRKREQQSPELFPPLKCRKYNKRTGKRTSKK